MAVLTHIIKNTNQETVIKVDTVANSSGTITLTDLTADTQALTPGGTPVVNIVKVMFSGELNSAIRITRNGENIFTCAPENAPFFDFTANGFTENRQNTYNIVIIKEGTDNVPVTGYIVLRKVSGWDTKVENATFGSHDDPTVVGS